MDDKRKVPALYPAICGHTFLLLQAAECIPVQEINVTKKIMSFKTNKYDGNFNFHITDSTFDNAKDIYCCAQTLTFLTYTQIQIRIHACIYSDRISVTEYCGDSFSFLMLQFAALDNTPMKY